MKREISKSMFVKLEPYSALSAYAPQSPNYRTYFLRFFIFMFYQMIMNDNEISIIKLKFIKNTQ